MLEYKQMPIRSHVNFKM